MTCRQGRAGPHRRMPMKFDGKREIRLRAVSCPPYMPDGLSPARRFPRNRRRRWPGSENGGEFVACDGGVRDSSAMRRSLWALVLLGVACSTSTGTVRPGPGAAAVNGVVLAGASTYATDPPAHGGQVAGPRAQELTRAVETALRARGDGGRADPTLSTLAAWYHG